MFDALTDLFDRRDRAPRDDREGGLRGIIGRLAGDDDHDDRDDRRRGDDDDGDDDDVRGGGRRRDADRD